MEQRRKYIKSVSISYYAVLFQSRKVISGECHLKCKPSTKPIMPKNVKSFQLVAVLLSWGFISSLACNNQYSGKRIKRTVLVIGVCAIALQIAVQYSLFTYLETTKDLTTTTGKYRPFNCTATSWVHRRGVSQKLTGWTIGGGGAQDEHVDVKEFFENLVADENLWVSLSMKSGEGWW